jgi:hypothetical protein
MQQNGEINLPRPTFIYRVREGGGGRFKKQPREDRCATSGGVCPLRRSEGDVFTYILRIVRGNGSSESTHFLEGLVLGNWAKNFHPRNVETVEFMNIFVDMSLCHRSVSW